MPIRVAINGFGRIGRNSLKAALGRLPELEIVAVNDLTDPATLAHLLRHDTNYGAYDRQVEHTTNAISVDGHQIKVYAEKDPSKLPWQADAIDVVLECTGRFTDQAGASAHLAAGAKRVIISAPAKGGDVPTLVLGVNSADYHGQAGVINNASCTTNCISPVSAVIQEKFGIKKAMMTTIHSYTADQNLQDGPHRDLRRARSAAVNIVPTTTGAAIATTETIPELKGRFDGLSLRVPTSVVSLSDITFVLNRSVTKEEVNAAFRAAANSPRFQGILATTDEELVSSDFIKNPHSAIVDLPLTSVVDGDLLKVVAWYDNEWGYANRLVEMAAAIGKSI